MPDRSIALLGEAGGRTILRLHPTSLARPARVAQPLRDDSLDEQRQSNPGTALVSRAARPVEIGTPVLTERDELPVHLDAVGQAPPELGQEVAHVPAAPTAGPEAGVGTDKAAETVQLGSNIQPAPRGIESARATMGSGSRSTTPDEPTASRAWHLPDGHPPPRHIRLRLDDPGAAPNRVRAVAPGRASVPLRPATPREPLRDADHPEPQGKPRRRPHH
jgi:hypothetical protein